MQYSVVARPNSCMETTASQVRSSPRLWYNQPATLYYSRCSTLQHVSPSIHSSCVWFLMLCVPFFPEVWMVSTKLPIPYPSSLPMAFCYVLLLELILTVLLYCLPCAIYYIPRCRVLNLLLNQIQSVNQTNVQIHSNCIMTQNQDSHTACGHWQYKTDKTSELDSDDKITVIARLKWIRQLLSVPPFIPTTSCLSNCAIYLWGWQMFYVKKTHNFLEFPSIFQCQTSWLL